MVVASHPSRPAPGHKRILHALMAAWLLTVSAAWPFKPTTAEKTNPASTDGSTVADGDGRTVTETNTWTWSESQDMQQAGPQRLYMFIANRPKRKTTRVHWCNASTHDVQHDVQLKAITTMATHASPHLPPALTHRGGP
mmetsp:Transcript_12492/g.38685  ORF Transcript_12492/g.38685 Transcript_12492/m.38685 type:complete len:139 (-) Transcript_12492:788-1204(-)